MEYASIRIPKRNTSAFSFKELKLNSRPLRGDGNKIDQCSKSIDNVLKEISTLICADNDKFLEKLRHKLESRSEITKWEMDGLLHDLDMWLLTFLENTNACWKMLQKIHIFILWMYLKVSCFLSTIIEPCNKDRNLAVNKWGESHAEGQRLLLAFHDLTYWLVTPKNHRYINSHVLSGSDTYRTAVLAGYSSDMCLILM